MSDVVRVKNQYYVRASSALADERTRVLKYGDTFGVFTRYGDIEPLGLGQFGLFHAETRHLSRMTLQVNGRPPLLLSSTIRDDNAFLSVDMTNLDSLSRDDQSTARGTVHVFRSKFLEQAACHEQIRLINYSLEPIRISLTFHFGADFADIFEIRGNKRTRKGERLPDATVEGCILFSYQGLDDVVRTTRIEFTPRPWRLTTRQAHYYISLNPKEECSVFVAISCERNSVRKPRLAYSTAFENLQERIGQERLNGCRIFTSDKRFNSWLKRSETDLQILTEGNPEGPYPYAGIPWFNTVFGRDGIITALECLWMAPKIAETVLHYLAEMQATEEIPEQEAEPGKILHEMRRGEMAALKEVPFGRYYGSVDSTPLFIILAGAYFFRTANRSFLAKIWPNIRAALHWIDKYGDVDGDGFVEYSRRSRDGLVQQGWKDSHDSIFHADGQIALSPIALCEVQGYVYAAKQSAAFLAGELGQNDLAEQLRAEASMLQKRFQRDFWCEDLGMYALALDGAKKPCRVRSSNAGQTLFCKIASQDHAAIMAQSLMAHDSFSGWGIRTVGASESRYNPMSYHNGSVWPHDNALIGLGLSLYGFNEAVCQILSGLYEASLSMDQGRLPELFCGFHKRSDASGPTLYPVACAPQAWAAGSVYMLLRACLGLNVRAQEQQIYFTTPSLPPNLDEVQIDNLRVGDAAADLLIRRHNGRVAVDVLRKAGDVEIIKAA